jgi:hypothetical protein
VISGKNIKVRMLYKLSLLKNSYFILFIILFAELLSIYTCSSITQDRNIKSIRINIPEVGIARYPIKDTNFQYVVNRLSNQRLEYYTKVYENNRIIPTFMHPFVAALHYGFAQHRPITISPDMVWLMILQGFSKHVQLNSDSIQDKVLKFKLIHGSENLVYWGESILENSPDWKPAKKNGKIVLAELTTEIEIKK